jgi:hypothetical protein
MSRTPDRKRIGGNIVYPRTLLLSGIGVKPWALAGVLRINLPGRAIFLYELNQLRNFFGIATNWSVS